MFLSIISLLFVPSIHFSLSLKVTKMYEEALKDKENAVTKMTQFEDEKKKLFVEKELLNGKILENSKVKSNSKFFISCC